MTIHLELSKAEQKFIAISEEKKDFTKEELKDFIEIITTKPQAASLKTKLTTIIETVWEKDTDRPKKIDRNQLHSLDTQKIEWIYEVKQSRLHQLRALRAQEAVEDFKIVAQETENGDVEKAAANLLQAYDEKIEDCSEELALLESELNAHKSYEYLDAINERLASSTTIQEFTYAYQDLQIAARTHDEHVSRSFEKVLSKALQLLTNERKRIGNDLKSWEKQTNFDADTTKQLFLEIVKLQVLTDFAQTLIPYANKNEKKSIKQATQDTKEIQKAFDATLTKKLKREIESAKETSQEVAVKFQVEGATVAQVSESEIHLRVINNGQESLVQEAVRLMGNRLISFERIAQIADLRANISPAIVAASKTSWISRPIVNGFTALGTQLAYNYLISQSNTDFLVHTTLWAANTFVTPYLVHEAAKRAGVTQYEYLLTPIAQVALPVGFDLTQKFFTPAHIVPPQPVSKPFTPGEILSQELVTPLQTPGEILAEELQAAAPLALPPQPTSMSQTPNEILAQELAAQEMHKQVVPAPPPQTAESWRTTAGKMWRAFEDLSFKMSITNLIPLQAMPIVTTVSTAIIDKATGGAVNAAVNTITGGNGS